MKCSQSRGKRPYIPSGQSMADLCHMWHACGSTSVPALLEQAQAAESWYASALATRPNSKSSVVVRVGLACTACTLLWPRTCSRLGGLMLF